MMVLTNPNDIGPNDRYLLLRGTKDGDAVYSVYDTQLRIGTAHRVITLEDGQETVYCLNQLNQLLESLK